MEIKCRCCGFWFTPCDEAIDQISQGYISSESVNTCDDCWDLQQLSEYDLSESFHDTDSGL